MFFFKYDLELTPFLFKTTLLFTKSIISACAGNMIFLQNGKSASLIEASSFIFWCIETFTSKYVEVRENASVFVNPLFLTDAALVILEQFSPDVYKILQPIGSEILSYAAKNLQSFFIEAKTEDEVKLLIFSISISGHPSIFVRALLCSFLSIISDFIKDTKGEEKQIEPLIDNVISRLNMRLLLLNAEKFTGFLIARVHD